MSGARRELALRVGGRGSWRFERRQVLASVLLVLAGLLASVLAMHYGDGWSSPGQVVDGALGEGPLAGRVLEWRMPRVAAALLFGAALGIAGALFQNITRNPLGAPDVIGLDQGAYTGVLLVLTVSGGAHLAAAAETDGAVAIGLSAAALLGGLIAAALVIVLAAGAGFSGLRLIVIGIAVNAVLTSINSWIILRAEIDVATSAASWSAGDLNGADWSDLTVPATALVLLAAATLPLVRPMHQMALGDDVAVASGIRLGRLRVLLVLVGVGFTAVVAAAAGPIVFVALMAPQIGRRIVGATGVPLMPAALTGAVLLVVADLLAQVVVAPVLLPVGVVTGAIGGVYLLWLLYKEVQR